MADNYTDPILAKIREHLNENGPAELKNNYVLGPIFHKPPKGMLPLAAIYDPDTTLGSMGGGPYFDDKTIRIDLIVDWTDDIDNSWDEAQGYGKITEYFEGRDSDYKVGDNSIIGCLRGARIDAAKNLFIDVETENFKLQKKPMADPDMGIYVMMGWVMFHISLVVT